MPRILDDIDHDLLPARRKTISHLQKAHQRHYHKATVEIISMVKHAAEERVKIAFTQIVRGRTFTPEQKRIVAKVDGLLSQCDELSARLRDRQATSQQLLAATIHHLLNGAPPATGGGR